MKFTFSILFLTIITTVFGTGPGTYYNSIDTTKSCSDFMTILKNRLRSGTSYIQYSDVDNNYNLTDLKPSEIGGGYAIADRYCTENPNGTDYCVFRYPSSFCLTSPPDSNQCNCYNKEHSFPSSWFGQTYPAYSDMHFVWPCDAKTNQEKSNFPLGNTLATLFASKNGSAKGTSNPAQNFGYNTSLVFEPIDSFKGDFARAYLYVATRYLDSLSSWKTRSTADYVISGSTYPGFDPWILQLCVQWHKLDPPSAFERTRNDAVENIQGNRNPYVDYPHWVERVFGPNGIPASCVPTAVKVIRQSDFSIYPNPANDMVHVKLRNFLLEDAQLTVRDVLGRAWMEQAVQSNDKEFSLNISGLPKGMYWIQLNYKADVSAVPFLIK